MPNSLLKKVIVQTLETDIPQYENYNVGTSRKPKRLLSIIAESVPFKPNFTKIAEIINVRRNSLDYHFHFMEQAGLIAQLRNETGGIRGLCKLDKAYLDNTNMLFTLVGDQSNTENLRETFFYNQMRVNHDVIASKIADFIINNVLLEVGGKKKKHKQIAQADKSFLVKDDLEFGYYNVIPLWTFGLNY